MFSPGEGAATEQSRCAKTNLTAENFPSTSTLLFLLLFPLNDSWKVSKVAQQSAQKNPQQSARGGGGGDGGAAAAALILGTAPAKTCPETSASDYS